MTAQEIAELAAILVNEHGQDALRIAQTRRDQYAHEPQSDAYRLWGLICDAATRLIKLEYAITTRAADREE